MTLDDLTIHQSGGAFGNNGIIKYVVTNHQSGDAFGNNGIIKYIVR